MSLKGKDYWKSLDQLSGSGKFDQFLHREFPQGASELNDGMSRRKFFTLMSASMALAGLAGCRRPVEKIIPYVIEPENIIPGIPLHYATTMSFGTRAYGLVVKSNEGRPTKIEGNPAHPSTLGSSNSFLQASILGLYDPDRSNAVIHKKREKGWVDFVQTWQEKYPQLLQNGGKGLAVLSESFASPTLSRLKDQFKTNFPNATWATFEPVSDENIFKGINIATGQNLIANYNLEDAKVILSLDSDFLHLESENIGNARGFTKGRQVTHVGDEMNRLYVVESSFSVTGSMADHRLRLQSRLIGAFAVKLMAALERIGVKINAHVNVRDYEAVAIDEKYVHALAKDLAANRGKCLIVAGRRQPAPLHALVLALNQALGNVNRTLFLHDSINISLPEFDSLTKLVDAMNNNKVETLFILGGNPIYNAPVDLDFTGAMAKVKNSVHLGYYNDETGSAAKWHIPRTHFLEEWCDARSGDGSLSIVQPLIAPLLNGHSYLELLNLIVSGRDLAGYELVRKTWRGILPKTDFEKSWRRVLHDGVFAASRQKPVNVKLNFNAISSSVNASDFPADPADINSLEVVFEASPSVFDGRFANNGWLQELPHPSTKLSWDNAALFSHATAKELGLKNEDLIKLSYAGRSVEAVVWILPGQADYSVSLLLGYGRQHLGRIADDVGFNYYTLRASDSIDFGKGLKVVNLHQKYELANVQDHWSMEGRAIVREATLEEYKQEPHFAEEMVEHPPLKNLWKEHKYDTGYQWGMTIDLNSCIGCNACTIACQSENNIPVIGKEQVRNGREMHWIRLDRYFVGDLDEPEMVHQPVGCQQCENAPCEQVCPVQATNHDKEGLNVMVYNRCIGTRYCSNNCPYKVRRFNFFNYTNELPELVKMAQNPEVTVRSRGVMEKCTYCIQRINHAKINAKEQGRKVRDGEIQTACQQACPTNAIQFGNILDPESRVAAARQIDRKYELLGELNTRPRTSYLAKLRNPNPELETT